jgi:hypothetical protein
MMPEFMVGPFDLFIERRLRELIGGVELIHDRFGGLSKLLVVEIDRVLVLLIEVLYPAARVAVRANVLHGGRTLLPVFQLEADDWPKCKADTIAQIMRYRLIAGRAHVAGGACGRRGVILANHTGLCIQIHFGNVGAERNAMFRFGVDLHLRMIRAQMALSAMIFSAILVHMSEELHQQRHHHREAGRIGSVQLSLGGSDPVQ